MAKAFIGRCSMHVCFLVVACLQWWSQLFERENLRCCAAVGYLFCWLLLDLNFSPDRWSFPCSPGVQAFGCIFHSIAFPHKVKWILGKGSYSEEDIICIAFHYQSMSLSDVVCQYCFAPNACCIGREKSSVDTSPHLFQATVERRKQRDYCRTNAAFVLWASKSCCISCWIWYWSVQVPFEAI